MLASTTMIFYDELVRKNQNEPDMINREKNNYIKLYPIKLNISLLTKLKQKPRNVPI